MEIITTANSAAKSSGRIATVGMFDGVHLGHYHLLCSLIKAGQERGLTPMAATFLRHPMAVTRPDAQVPSSITTLPEKIALLEATGLAECLLLDFDHALMALSAREFLCMLRDCYDVRAFVTGFNNRFGSDCSLTFTDYAAIAASEGIELIVADEFASPHLGTTISSSAIRSLISTEGNVSKAASMLGRPFSLTGNIVHGNAIGRSIGFPTANIAIDNPSKILPLDGVYACQAIMPEQYGNILPAMVNIGRRPTLDDGRGISIEAHIIGLSHDIYDLPLTLRFLQRLRDEHRFNTIEELKSQLTTDLHDTLETINPTL